MNFILGFFCGIIGFLISPQYKFSGSFFFEFLHIIKHALVFGLFFGFSSSVNGHNYYMLKKSRVDFLINVLVSAIIGCFGVLLFNYIVNFYLIGRWVLFISFCSYFWLHLINAFVWSGRCGGSVYIIGQRVGRFRELVRDLGSSELSAFYNYIESPLADENGVLSDFEVERCRDFYLVPVKSELDRFVSHDRKLVKSNIDRVISMDLLIEKELGMVDIESLKGLQWWDLPTALEEKGFMGLKRLLDVVISVMLLLISFPIILLAAFAIKLSDGGPVIYRQIRLGQFGTFFSILKLRTMRVDSEKGGAQWAGVVDPRVSKVGRILRRTRIDELPQVWNIFRGDMSFIGPRPERPEFYSLLTNEVPEFFLRLKCKPGLTGWAQVNYPYGGSVHDSRMKMLYDIYYIKHAGLILDLRIITRTVIAMVKGAR